MYSYTDISRAVDEHCDAKVVCYGLGGLECGRISPGMIASVASWGEWELRRRGVLKGYDPLPDPPKETLSQLAQWSTEDLVAVLARDIGISSKRLFEDKFGRIEPFDTMGRDPYGCSPVAESLVRVFVYALAVVAVVAAGWFLLQSAAIVLCVVVGAWLFIRLGVPLFIGLIASMFRLPK